MQDGQTVKPQTATALTVRLHSAWDLPLSVTQHSLTVLALRTASAGGGFTKAEARRELLHDATEALLGGWDPITPLKPHLGDGFHRLVARLQAALDERYQLPAWDDAAYRRHKYADHLAAASEVFHVAGWSRDAMRNDLQIVIAPLEDDPLDPQPGFRLWEPWPPKYATERFLVALQSIKLHSEDATICLPAPTAAASVHLYNRGVGET
jgi:hypothetical protein